MTNEDYMDIFSGFNSEEGDLIPLLQGIQERFGYISEEAIKNIREAIE